MERRDAKYVLHGETSFTESERACIQKGIDLWGQQTGGQAQAEIVWDFRQTDPPDNSEYGRHQRVERWLSTEDRTIEADWRALQDCIKAYGLEPCAGIGILGSATPGGIHNPWGKVADIHIVVDRLTDPHWCSLVAAHEFGHWMGLNHSKDKADIMWESMPSNKALCLTEGDLQAWAKVNKGDMAKTSLTCL